MKWAKRLGIVVFALVLLLAALPFFVSLDDYRPQIEKAVADTLKEPVKLKKLRLSGLPLPHVVVEGIEIGNAGELNVGAVKATPDLLSLFSATKVIRSIDITGLVITQRALEKIPGWAQADPKAKPAELRVLVQSINLDDALLKLQKASFGPFDARVAIAANGLPERADITARDGKFKATIRPVSGKFDVEVKARDWRLPAGPPILFEELLVRGVATLNDIELQDVKAKLYGGTVTGRTTIAWQKGFQVQGGYTVTAVELRELVPLFSPQTRLSGRLTAKPVFTAHASKPEQFAAALKLTTPFDIREGVLQGIDIQKAATSLISKDSSGETRFDRLSGHYALDRSTQRITGLKVVSGSLAADGNVTVAPNKALSGRINAQVGSGAASVVVPLNISGTVGSPMALPTGASMAGAAVGTAILGPGVGTSVGAKVGNWAEGLFGGEAKPEPKKK